jgi:hypothetical protein
MIRLKAAFYSLMIIVSFSLFMLPFLMPLKSFYIEGDCRNLPTPLGSFASLISTIFMIMGVVAFIIEMIHRINKLYDE